MTPISLAASIALKEDFSGTVEETVRLSPYLNDKKGHSHETYDNRTAALAQAGTSGYGSVVAPSVGSYVWPSVGSTTAVPTWRNTGPAAPLPSAPTVFSPFPASR